MSPISSSDSLPATGDSAKDEKSFHKNLLDNMFDGVYFVDAKRRITYWNHGAENLTGYSANEAIGRRCYDNFLAHVDSKGCALCFGGCPLAKTIKDGQRREADVILRHKLGHRLPVCVRVAPITDQSGKVVGAVEVFSDISAQKQAERRAHELESMAFRDSLTALPNRRYTELKVNQALEEARQFGRAFGLLMIDIDHFKQVNDLYGHDAGDAILHAVSATLTKSLRESDLVGRWGGEEFVVLLADVAPATLLELAERCRVLVEHSRAMVENKPVSVTISIGATLVEKGDSAESAIKRADQSLYLSKSRGRNQTAVG